MMESTKSLEVEAEEKVEVALLEGAVGPDPNLARSNKKSPYMGDLEAGMSSINFDDASKFPLSGEEFNVYKTPTGDLNNSLVNRNECLTTEQDPINSEDGLSSYGSGDDSVFEPDDELPNYQKMIFNICKKQNTIACLPTGTGKTLIAVKLMNEYRNVVIRGGKKLIFVADTADLIKQQTEYIKSHTAYKVEYIIGGGKKSQRNRDVVEKMDFHVLVLTSNMFHDLLQHQYLQFNKIALIVFDECHHTVKQHPMNIIMQQYKDIRKQDSSYELPRILGLTATVVGSTAKANNIIIEIKAAEKRLCSTAITFEAYEEAMKYSTTAEIYTVMYRNDPKTEWDVNTMLKEIERTHFFFWEMNANGYCAPQGDVVGQESFESSKPLWHLPQKFKHQLINLLMPTEYALKELGIRCGFIAAMNTVEYIQDMMNSQDDEYQSTLLNLTATTLQKIMFLCKTKLQDNDDLLKTIQSTTCSINAVSEATVAIHEILLSYKVCHLLSILRRFHGTELSPSYLRGIIFVDKRATAYCLYQLIAEAAESMPQIYGFISPAVSLGKVRRFSKSSGFGMAANKQAELLKGFRDNQYNLLISTSALEEGINVAACNIVIRFDKIGTYSSFVQSMGRARQQNAQFYALINEENSTMEIENIMEYSRTLKMLTNSLAEQMRLIFGDGGSNDDTSDEDEHNALEVFCPGGTLDSPRIDLFSTINIVNRYCKLLQPVEAENSNRSLWWWEPTRVLTNCGTTVFYRAYVLLPPNAVVNSLVEGPLKQNIMLAKKHAYMEMVKLLYACGVLNEHLIPTVSS